MLLTSFISGFTSSPFGTSFFPRSRCFHARSRRGSGPCVRSASVGYSGPGGGMRWIRSVM